jgi:hypothetical protein
MDCILGNARQSIFSMGHARATTSAKLKAQNSEFNKKENCFFIDQLGVRNRKKNIAPTTSSDQ